MFDIGFLEILLILIIALLVIGPERMPEVARAVGGFMGKMRRFINSVKEEGHMQETLRDLKQSMDLASEKKQMDSMAQDLQSGMDFGDGLNLEDFKRPFGGSVTPTAETTEPASQYNRAPEQPVMPTASHDKIDSDTTLKTPQTAEKPVERPKIETVPTAAVSQAKSSPNAETRSEQVKSQ